MYRVSRQLFGVGQRALPKPGISSVPRVSTSFVQRSVYSTKDPKKDSDKTHTAGASKPIFSAIDSKHDAEVSQQQIKSPPASEVTSTSSISGGIESENPKPRSRVVGGIKSELSAVKDAFSMESVPREANLLGLAGTLPYLGTSLSTVYLSWSLNRDWPGEPGMLNSMAMTHDSASHYLTLLEPIQLGYGAVIISFLGAIHWGMEWNERKPADHARSRARYAIGVMAPALAWPTLMMPLEFALTSQFLAFSGLYFIDARMAERGWAPRWYSPYRYLLTAVVGAAVGITLIGRAKIVDSDRKQSNRTSILDMGPATNEGHDWEQEEAKARAQMKKAKEEAEKKAKEAKTKAKDVGGTDDKKTADGKKEDNDDKESEESEEGDNKKNDQQDSTKKEQDDTTDEKKDNKDKNMKANKNSDKDDADMDNNVKPTNKGLGKTTKSGQETNNDDSHRDKTPDGKKVTKKDTSRTVGDD